MVWKIRINMVFFTNSEFCVSVSWMHGRLAVTSFKVSSFRRNTAHNGTADGKYNYKNERKSQNKY